MEKEKILAVLKRKNKAIDYTPIYYFQATDTIRKGDIIRFDAAEKILVKATEEYKQYEDIEV